jgi:hypothetical protein
MFFRKKSALNRAAETPARSASGGAESADTVTAAQRLEDILQIIETTESEPFVGDLFRRKFGADPPDFPRHFVALYSRDGASWQAVGYVNFWPRQAAFMGGGLVIEDRVFRLMPAPHRALIRSGGGLAEYLLKSSLGMLPVNDVVWAYVGDARAEKVDLSVGFVYTHIDKILAYWNREHSAEEKIRLADEIAAVGPF